MTLAIHLTKQPLIQKGFQKINIFIIIEENNKQNPNPPQ